MRFFCVPLIEQTVLRITDILLPTRADAQIVRKLDSTTLHSLSKPTKLKEVVALLPYPDARVRACIHETKFHKNEYAIALLAHTLRKYLHTLEKPVDFVIPIPLSQARYKERGYNQVLCVAKDTHFPYYEALRRTKNTVPQTKLDRAERLKNVVGTFVICDQNEATRVLSGKHVVLLDDVVTTGATLMAARASLAPLRPSLASLTLIALAH